MNDLSYLSLLPAADQAELQAEVLEKIKGKFAAAKQEELELQEQESRLKERLELLTDSIQKYQVFISYSHANAPVTSVVVSKTTQPPVEGQPKANQNEPTKGGYDKQWPQQQRLLYIIERPEVYGHTTFVGAKSVIAATLREEPELVGEESNISLMKRIGPALSRLAKVGQLKKMAERARPSRIHYLSIDWFDGDTPKPAYQERLAPFDLVAIRPPVPNNTASSLRPLAVQESTSVDAEEDANADTDEVNPPVYKAKEQNRLLEPAELFLTS